MNNGWIGVDLDGTLAEYDTWRGVEHIGTPIPAMVERVKKMLQEGSDVRIFTARVFERNIRVVTIIEKWCKEHLGRVLPITCTKDYGMIKLFDDRAIQVEFNKGTIVGNSAELKECLDYATKLAIAMQREYPQNPEWKPLPDLLGLLTQIDNMAAGMKRKIRT